MWDGDLAVGAPVGRPEGLGQHQTDHYVFMHVWTNFWPGSTTEIHSNYALFLSRFPVCLLTLLTSQTTSTTLLSKLLLHFIVLSYIPSLCSQRAKIFVDIKKYIALVWVSSRVAWLMFVYALCLVVTSGGQLPKQNKFTFHLFFCGQSWLKDDIASVGIVM